MDSVEVLTDSYNNEIKNNRYEHLAICVGNDILERLWSLNLFMVGVGALGCELIKNFAMIGISSNYG
jgi:molybdopterin/thiamine biosynthesis adenylyltransferase